MATANNNVIIFSYYVSKYYFTILISIKLITKNRNIYNHDNAKCNTKNFNYIALKDSTKIQNN